MRRGDPGVPGRLELVSWLKRRYPMLKPDPLDPLNYQSVVFNRMRPNGKVFERVELVNASIEEISEDGTIVCSFESVRVRPWWRALYRWLRKLVRKPLPVLEGK